MRSALLFLSSIASTMGYFVPLCNYNLYGQYVCYPPPPPAQYFDFVRDVQQHQYNGMNANLQFYQNWQSDVLQHQTDYANRFPWLTNNPFVQHQQTLQKEWLEYYQGFQQGQLDRAHENEQNRLNHNEAVSESLSG